MNAARFIAPFVLLLPAVPVGAQSPEVSGPAKAAAAGSGATTAKPAPTKRPGVIEIDSVKVEGDVQKPEAFYILQRSELVFQGRTPQKAFIPLILGSVDKEPF